MSPWHYFIDYFAQKLQGTDPTFLPARLNHEEIFPHRDPCQASFLRGFMISGRNKAWLRVPLRCKAEVFLSPVSYAFQAFLLLCLSVLIIFSTCRVGAPLVHQPCHLNSQTRTLRVPGDFFRFAHKSFCSFGGRLLMQNGQRILSEMLFVAVPFRDRWAIWTEKRRKPGAMPASGFLLFIHCLNVFG